MVKAVTLRRKGTKIVVERAGLMAMPGGAISGRQILDPPAVSDCVKRLCKDLGLRGRRVAVAVAGDEVAHARLKVERSSVEALETLVRQELARVAPFPLEEALIDFQVLDNFAHSQWLDAVAVAAKRAAVERLEQVMERAGKQVTVADSTACALANIFEINYQPASNEITALLHLGAGTMTVCILRGPTPLVVRDITLETTQPWREQAGSAERVAVELERLLEQMDEIADDHPLEPRSKQVSRIMLSGGGIRLRGLEEVLRTRLRMPLEELNPFKSIEFAGSDALGRLVWDHVHCMPVAAGLAMRGLDTTAAGSGVEA
jgi:type IV pilus assembly protein PilM